MAIDTSIYNNQKLFQAPDLMAANEKALTLSQLAMQNSRLKNQMSREDQEAAVNRNDQRIYRAGQAFEALYSLKPEERPQAYRAIFKPLVDSGLIGANEIPEQYDEGLVNSIYAQTMPLYRQSKGYMENQLLQGKINELTKKVDPMDQGLDRRKKLAEIRKLESEAGKTTSEKQPTQSQFVAATYGTRAKQAEDVFSELAGLGFDPTNNKSTVERNLPDVLEGFKGENVKRQTQAERNFVNAIMRRESGAAISDSEFKNAKSQYFPQYGDTAEVIRQKEANRKTAIAALSAEGAPAMGAISERMSGMDVGATVPKSKSDSSLVPNANADSSLPKIGEEVDGYIYLGGDRAKEKNWKRAR